ncbi:shikimate dehydrogenase [Georgenia sp. Z1344]|uniref:shikimate dehydrogenase n=1 Tax=Georgenia sp. Z1344 TaxID=3416706 RepID=UPI003CF92515
MTAGEVLVGQDVHAAGVRHRAAVVGSPVAHSLSPTLHRAAYRSLGLTDWAYGVQDVTVDQLPAVMGGLDETWAGLSVTMPLKLAAAAAVDVKDSVASLLGVVNTLVVQPGGLIVGANTDVAGITGALADAGVTRVDGPVVILGARATASSAVAALGSIGARELTLLARNVGGPGSALPVAHRAGLAAQHVRLTDEDGVRRALAGAAVVVSTLPRGVADPVAELVPDLRPDAVLLDVVYDPTPTPLAAAWAAAGGRVAEGWGMLLHQAVDQVRLWTGRQPDVAVMRSALLDQLAVRATGVAIPDSPPVLPPAV